MMIDLYYQSLYSDTDTGLIDFDLHSRSQECKKAKSSVPVISQSFQSLWMEFGKMLRLVSVMSFCLIRSVFKGENYSCDFIKKKL